MHLLHISPLSQCLYLIVLPVRSRCKTRDGKLNALYSKYEDDRKQIVDMCREIIYVSVLLLICLKKEIKDVKKNQQDNKTDDDNVRLLMTECLKVGT